MTIEQIIRDHLLLELGDEVDGRVYLNVPAEPELPRVVIERTAGRIEDGLRHGTLAVQSIAGSLYEAAELNDKVVAAMYAARSLGSVGSVRLNTDYDFTEKSIGYRYQAVFDIVYYD